MQKKLLISAVVALVLIGGAVLVWEKKTVQIVPQNEVKYEGENQSGVNQEKAYAQHIEAISGMDVVWYGVPELGIRMKLNKDFAEDLIYSVSRVKKTYGEKEEIDVADFSTRSMMRIDAHCAPDKGSSSAMSRSRGVAKEVARTDEYIASRLDNLIQIGDFYYMFTKPQATCWGFDLTPEALKDLGTNKYKGDGVKSLDEGFKNIQPIPLKGGE